MQDETNGQTSNQDEGNQGALHAASEQLHVLSAESLGLVAGGGNGTIIVEH